MTKGKERFSEVYFRFLFSNYPYLSLCSDLYYDGPFF